MLEKVYSKRGNQNPIKRNWHLKLTTIRIFQSVRKILQKIHILLTLDQKDKKVFHNIPVLGFCNGKI